MQRQRTSIIEEILKQNPKATPMYAEKINNPDEWETDPDYVVNNDLYF